MIRAAARLARLLLPSVLAAVVVSCGREPTAPKAIEVVQFGGDKANIGSPGLVISQVYAGAASSGAVLQSKYVELFNRGSSTVNLAGMSLQYASATGTGNFSGQAPLALAGSVAPGKYFLVQVGTGGSSGAAIPTPDQVSASGLNPAAGAGKLIIANVATGLACNGSAGQPCNAAQLAQIVDLVGYGTANFFEDGAAAPAPSATLAIIRKGAGCQDLDSNSGDFATGTPAPRNSATAAQPCGPSIAVAPPTASIHVGDTQAFAASETDGTGSPVSGATFAWSSSDAAIATIDPSTGVATAVASGTVTITATDAGNSVAGTAQLTITAAIPVVTTVTVTPNPANITTGTTQQFAAAAKDQNNNPIATTFTWTSDNTPIATVDATGLATATATPGTAHIRATAPNAVFAEATLNSSLPLANRSGEIVISTIYGGGGNGGATYKNDYIELFNRGTQPVSVSGWSVQYVSAGGTGWAATPLTGTIQPGSYFLVQESQGAGGTVDLPAPDVTGTLAMGGTAGKVLLAQTATPFAVACPAGTVIVDIVSYGTGTNCGNAAPTISASTADLRKHGGCQYTPNPSLDFTATTPTPRNSASPTRSCVAGPLDHITLSGAAAVLAGATIQLAAEALDANDNTVVGALISWSTSDAATATVSANGLVTGVANTGHPATITATADAGGITKTASVDVDVTTPGGINWVDISGSTTSFPPGFQTQMFATARESQNGTVIPATFTFEAADPQYISVLTVSNTGLITGVSPTPDAFRAGVRVTATPTAGGTPYTFVSHSFTIEQPLAAPLSAYGNNDAFGDPTPTSANNPNDFLIRRNQYVLSYNQSRGTPNWVSYELDLRQIATGQDRCNCFTADPLLPANKQIFTSDYTNGGFDRGHMEPSADRTAGNVDNAFTFMLTNVVPQQGDLNQGVWANFEGALRDSVHAGRAVYVIVGPLYSAGHPLTYLKDEGKVAIPDSTWKIALIGPANGGNPFSTVASWNDLNGLTLMAVNMPNVAGVRGNPWQMYLTTVDKIEQSTGYDFLSLLQTGFQAALDYKDHAPVAQFSVTGTQNEGSALTFDASASTDPDFGRADLGGRTEGLSYSWQFSDGSTASGAVVAHTFANSGPASATLTVTDVFGWPATSTSGMAIANLAPTATFNAPVAGTEGTPFALTLTGVTDISPSDAAALQFAFDCGSGYGAPSSSATASCSQHDQGDYAVRGKVIDPDGGFTEYSGNVHVMNAAPTATFGAPSTVDEGGAIALALTGATDPSSADVAAGFTYAFDCGTGSGFGAPGSAATATCPTTEPGTRAVRGRVIDKDGGATDYAATVVVNNVAPSVTLTPTTATTITSGQTVAATGSFTDPGADSPWGYLFSWGAGANATGSLATSGASATASRQYLTAGSYTVSFTVTDSRGASSLQSFVVTVNRRDLGSAEVDPNEIKLNENGNGDIKVTLRSTSVDLRTLNLASVRIGSVGISTKGNGDFKAEVQVAEAQLHFERKALIQAGVLTPTTTAIFVVGDLSTGVQFTARGAVKVH